MAVEDIPANLIVNERTSYEQYLWELPGSGLYRWDSNISYMYLIRASPVEGQGLPPLPPVPPIDAPFSAAQVGYLDSRFVRTVNGIPIDSNGNVAIELIDEQARAQVAEALSALSGKADLVNGTIPTSQLPPLVITDTSVVSSQAAMLALQVQKGDIAVRTDISATFILAGDDPSVISNWVQLATPPGGVLSVNTKTGAVVLGKGDIGLSNVDNTSDMSKPVSTAQGVAIAAKYTKPSGGIPDSDLASVFVKTVNGSAPDASGNVTVSGGGGGDVPSTRKVSAGSGLTGGGDLSADRSIAISSATLATIAKAGTSVQTIDGVSPDSSGNVILAGKYDSVQELQYVAYGHSFGQQQGYWNTTAAGTYPNRVRDIIKSDVNSFANRTVSGQRAAAMATTVQNTYRRGDYGIVSMMICQNDAGYRTDITAFKASIQQAIDWIRGPGEFAPTIVLVLDTYSTQAGYNRYPTPLTDAVMDQYNQAVRDVAALYPADGSVILADANTGWDRNTMTALDGQHPNDRGSAFIAHAIAKALANKPYREGQNIGFTAPTFIYDSFNRPDNTTIKGSMYGNSYTTIAAQAAATFGVIGGQAYRSSTSDTTSEAIAVLDSGSASVDISAVMSVITTKGMGIAWRASDINNYWCLDVRSGQSAVVYQKVAGGAFTAIGSPFSIAINNGDTVRITHNNAGTIRGYVNGVQAFSGTNNALNTNTKHGIRITEAPGSASRIDDLIIK